MIGAPQVQKLGMAANGTAGPFASGWYSGAGFISDSRSPNGLGNLWDALNVVVPNSGLGRDALNSFSVIASGNFGGSPAGAWTFNLCLANPPLPALTPEILSFYVGWSNPTLQYARNFPQFLPVPSASVTRTVGSNSTWSLEADVLVSNGTLSGTWALLIDGSSVATGALTNLPANLAQPIAAYVQIGAMPAAASINSVVLAVSVMGFTGSVRTLNL